MSEPLKVLMVTSEITPFAKAGGLADMVGSLSKALAGRGHDVRVMLPRYYFIDPIASGLSKHEAPLGVPLGTGEQWTSVYECRLPSQTPPVRVYFIEHQDLYGRDGIYGTRLEPDFPDNVERFALLCRGAFQLCRMLNWIPDVIHAHDWPAALAMVYLRLLERQAGFERSRGVFTIHNMGYQGVYPKEKMQVIGLPWEYYLGAGLEFYDKINLLKAGILVADSVSTVSPSYAREILEPKFGFYLDGVVRSRLEPVVGILNGIDYQEWDPESDPHLPVHFSTEDPSAKAELKARLQAQTGLPVNADKPLVAMIGRLVEQKGFSVLCDPRQGVLPRVLRELDLQLVILGTGTAWIEEELARLAWKHSNLKVILQFNVALSHLIEAAADFFLMPSMYEPCGLNQLFSLRYGAVPIATGIGGLTDTVEPYDTLSGRGTGFRIADFSPEAVYQALAAALAVYRDKPDHLARMRRNGMEKRFSWDRSAAEYEKLYRGGPD